MNREPEITINGVMLSEGAAMTIRVAVANFHDYVKQNDAGLGKIGKAYADQCEGIQRIMGVLR